MVRYNIDEFPVREEELEAYVDGFLDDRRRAAVEGFLAKHPGLAARLATYLEQRTAMQAVYGPIAGDPLPREHETLGRQLASAVVRRRRVHRAAGWAVTIAAATFVVSGGWLTYHAFGVPDDYAAETAGPSRSIAAHRAAVSDSPARSAVELRPGGMRRAPDLRRFGFEIAGATVFLIGDRQVAQLVYRHSNDDEIDLFVSAIPQGGNPTELSFARDDKASVFDWRHGRLEFAVVGRIDRATLMAIAEAVQREFGGANPSPIDPTRSFENPVRSASGVAPSPSDAPSGTPAAEGAARPPGDPAAADPPLPLLPAYPRLESDEPAPASPNPRSNSSLDRHRPNDAIQDRAGARLGADPISRV